MPLGNSYRPVLSRSDASIHQQRTPRCSRWGSRQPPIMDLPHPMFAWAISGCFPRWLPPDIRVLIEKFLAVTGDLGHVASALRSLARDAKIKLDAALDLLEARTDCFAARGVKAGSIRFSTAFGRGLDYYSGFVFEL